MALTKARLLKHDFPVHEKVPIWMLTCQLCSVSAGFAHLRHGYAYLKSLAHQNRTIAIASDFRVDGTKLPEIPQKEGGFGSGHGRPRRKSWTSTPKSAVSCSPSGGEKLFDPMHGHPGVRVRNVRGKSGPKSLCYAVFLP